MKKRGVWIPVGQCNDDAQTDAVRVVGPLLLHVWPAGLTGNWWGQIDDHTAGALVWNMAEAGKGPLFEKQAKALLVQEAGRILVEGYREGAVTK